MAALSWKALNAREPSWLTWLLFPRRPAYHARSLSAEERAVVAARKAHWREVRRAHDQGRRTLNAKFRRQLLPKGSQLPPCTVCSEVVASKELHLDHIIPVLDFVQEGYAIETAYFPANMWFLCKPCHVAKTKGPKRCPPLEELQSTHWAQFRSPSQQQRDWKEWDAGLVEHNRRVDLVDIALKGRMQAISEMRSDSHERTPRTQLGGTEIPSLRS